MVSRRWALPIPVVLGLAMLIISCVRLPLVRTAGYGAMVREYSQATTVLPDRDESTGLKWNAELPLSGGAIVRIHAPGHMGVVRVQYPDEAQPRQLYKYKDYSNPIAIRIRGHKLFVHWAETLFGTDYWLLAYDIENRREIEKRRVDPKDMPAPN